jgi:hypothetical protein
MYQSPPVLRQKSPKGERASTSGGEERLHPPPGGVRSIFLLFCNNKYLLYPGGEFRQKSPYLCAEVPQIAPKSPKARSLHIRGGRYNERDYPTNETGEEWRSTPFEKKEEGGIIVKIKSLTPVREIRVLIVIRDFWSY